MKTQIPMIYFFILILSCACAIPALAQQPPTVSMTLQVKVPANTPSTDTVWILSGPIFNAAPVQIPMNRVPGTTDTWQASISAPEGTVFRYFYNRNKSYNTPESYVPFETWSPNTFNYRELIVRGGVTVSETVAKWKGITTATVSTGIVTGKVTDQNGQPLNGIRVSAGPHQRMTSADGVYLIEGVPSGSCTLTIRSENGEYRAVAAIVDIDTGASTQKDIVLTAAQMSTVTFNVRVPNDTPAFAVPRLYGDSYRLGMVENVGSITAEPTRSIEMTPAGANLWTYSAQLGNGTCVTYLYTLGHFARNNEKDATGAIVTRSLSVNGSTTVNDIVAAWKTPQQVPVSLTVTSPTRVDDVLYVTTSQDAGGFWLMKMWPTGPGKATYTIYANPNTTLNYRYFRNGDPGKGMEIIGTDLTTPVYRSIPTGPGGTSSTDTVTAWRHQSHEQALTSVATGIDPPIKSRPAEAPFQTGVKVKDYWRPAWLPLVDTTMARVKSNNVQWVQIVPVWGVNWDSPSIERIPNSMPDQDLITHIRSAKGAGLKVAIASIPYPNQFPSGRTPAWLDQFFHEVELAALHDSKIAQQEGCELFILAEFYLNSADNNPGIRTYVNVKQKGLIAAIRANGYTGKITANGFFNGLAQELDWQGDLDYIGLKWWSPVATTDHDTVQQMYDSAVARLNSDYLPIFNRFHKPIMFAAVAYSSANGTAMQRYPVDDIPINDFLPADPNVPSDYDEQARAYQAVLLAMANTPWVAGAYIFGYDYFDFDSKGHTTTGKTADQIVSQVYQKINQATLTVNVPPSIVGQPQNQTANLGQSVTFNVIAYGTAPLTYQWQFNGVNRAGATNATLSLTNIQGLDSGIYTVVISNSFGSVTSAPATMDVVRTINKFDNSAEASQWRFDFGKATHSAVFDPTVDADGNRSSGSLKITLGFDPALGSENKGAFTRDIVPSIDGSTITSLKMDVLVDPNSAHDTSGVNANTSLVIRNGSNLFYNPQVYRDLNSSYGWVHIETPLSGAVDQIRALTWHVWGAAPQNINGTVTMWIDNLVFDQKVTATSISITAQPKDQTVAAGQAVTFSVSATASLPLSYQWQFNGANILGATSSTLTLPSVQASNAGNYRAVVSNSAGTVTSAAATLTVTVPPLISAQPQSQAVNLGGSVTFNVIASGTVPLAYQWQKDGVAIPGATGGTLTVNNVQLSNVGSYTVVVSNAAGSVSSAAAILSVGKVKQAISFGPLGNKQAFDPPFALSATASSGLPVQFSVVSGPATVSGNLVTVSVAGTIVIRASQPGNAQYEAAPIVEQSFQVIDPAPQITVQPKSQTFVQGANVTFAVEASGATPLNYQWQFNGVNISGATGPTLNLSNVQPAKVGSYTAVVSNSFGSVTSATATLTMTPLLVINRFDNAAEAGQWRFSFGKVIPSIVFDPAVDADGNSLSGSLKVTFRFDSILSNDNKGNLTRDLVPGIDPSNIAAIHMDFLVDRNSAVAQAGDNGFLSISARTNQTTTILQYHGSVSSKSGWIHIDAPPTNLVDQIRGLNWEIYGGPGENITGTVTLWIDNIWFTQRISIAGQPVNQTVTVGQTATFSVIASADSALTYQWQFNGVNIPGATSSTLTLPNVQSAAAGSYRVVVSSTAGSVTSAVAMLTVNAPPSISVQPQSQTVNSGATVTFSVTAVGTAPLSYRWQFNGMEVAGATDPALELKTVKASNAGTYTVVVSNAAGSVTSTAATLVINVPLSILLQPQGQTVIAGTNVSFAVSAAGTPPLSYQWQKSEMPIPGATNATLTLTNIQPADAGNYAVLVSNPSGSVTSAVATLTVNLPPLISGQPQSQTVVVGTTVSLVVTVSGTEPLGYQWRKNTADLPGATNSTLTLNNVRVTDAGDYTVVATNIVGSVTSVPATLTVTRAGQMIVFDTIVGKTYGDLPFSIQAVASSGLPLALTVVAGPALVEGTTVRLTGAGTVTIRASQPGDDLFGPAPDVERSFDVVKANQTISFDPLADKRVGDSPFMVNASVSAGLPVVFSIVSGPAKIEGNTITLTGVGTVVVRASQTGDANYNAAPEVDRVFRVLGGVSSFNYSVQGGFKLTYDGEIGRTYSLEVSEDLVTWTILDERSNTTGQMEFVDSRPAGSAGRFYRVRVKD